ncbi:plasmid mobilization protein [Acutalibacter muris]|jgi:hypothetical protein|uniref:plasmid mobilization protein n=1 Tax=Acutalibacter muris TaxID=1796620 RepID=UPI0026F3FDD1|nr:plasmid mobilization relaxosome protein MobC [Acutalibacter muris]
MAICEGFLERGRTQDFTTFSRDERTKGAENLPLGRASIASGYTPSAGAGRPGSPPRPPKGGVIRARTHKRERDFILKKKTSIITARLTPSEKTAIQKRAKKAKMTMTDYIVQCALGKEIVRVDGLGDVLSELKAQGRNINQLATLANMGRVSVVQSEDLIAAYSKLCSQLEKIAGEVNS